jgi:hypothetical protein
MDVIKLTPGLHFLRFPSGMPTCAKTRMAWP